jgi:hypothetical protein
VQLLTLNHRQQQHRKHLPATANLELIEQP